ncbi:MAG: hypothetical protein AB7V14_03325, partial [Kiritimatiellia bacterium]
IVCPIDRTDSQPYEVRVSLPNARIRSFRIDPFGSAGNAQIDQIRIADRKGRVLYQPQKGEIRAGNDIASLCEEPSGKWTVITTADASDPSIVWVPSATFKLSPVFPRALWGAGVMFMLAWVWSTGPWIRARNAVIFRFMPSFGGLLIGLWCMRMFYIWGKLAFICPEGVWPVARFGLLAVIIVFGPGLFSYRALKIECESVSLRLLLVVTISLGFCALYVWQLYFWGIYTRTMLIAGLVGMAVGGLYGLQGGGILKMAHGNPVRGSDWLSIALGIIFVQGLFESAVGVPFEAWDALVSWDKWAVDMAAREGVGEYLMGGYPQFFPAVHSIFYKIAGTYGDVLPTEQMLLHGFTAIYVAILMLALWCVGQILGIPGLLCFVLFAWNRNVFEYLVNGFVDIPLVGMVFSAMALAMAYVQGAWKARTGWVSEGWILSLGLFSAAFMKGNGLLWALFIALFMAIRLWRRWGGRSVALAVVLVCLFTVPFYAHQLWYTKNIELAERSPFLHAFPVVLAHTAQFSATLEHVYSWGRLLRDYYALPDALAPWALIVAAGLSLWAISQRKTFMFPSLGILMLIVWFYSGSYDLRNAFVPIGFLCVGTVAAPFDPRLGTWGAKFRLGLCLVAAYLLVVPSKDGWIQQVLTRPFQAFRPPSAYSLPADSRYLALESARVIRPIMYDTPYGQRAVHLSAGSGLYRHLAPRGVYAINFNSYQEARRHDLLVCDRKMKREAIPEGFVSIASLRHSKRGETLHVYEPVFCPVDVAVQSLEGPGSKPLPTDAPWAANRRYSLSVSQPDFAEAEGVSRDGVLSIRISPPDADVEVALHPDDARRDPYAAYLGPIRDGEWIRLLYWMRDEGPAFPRIMATVGGRDVRLAAVEWGQ